MAFSRGYYIPVHVGLRQVEATNVTMPANHLELIAACLAMVLLGFAVGGAMLFTRVREMRSKRIHPQAVANSVTMAARLDNVQIADNFRNLFETPVLFLALGCNRAGDRLCSRLAGALLVGLLRLALAA